MSDLNELAVAAGGNVLAELPQASVDLFDDMPSLTILPYVLLEGSQSNKFKEDKVSKGVFTLNTRKDEFTDMGTQFECFVIDVRYKAIDLQDKKNLVWTFKPGTERAKGIEALSDSKDLATSRGRLYGLEFLFYLPDIETDSYRYATLFLGSKSGRVETPRFRSVMRKSALIKSDKAKNDKGTWEVLKVFGSSRKIELPDLDEAQRIIGEFKSPKEMEQVQAERAAREGSSAPDENAEAERG